MINRKSYKIIWDRIALDHFKEIYLHFDQSGYETFN